MEILYAAEHGGDTWRELFPRMVGRGKLNPEGSAFVERLLATTSENKTEIDGYIASASEHWDMERMASVDRIIMRLGTAQLAYMPDIPPKVAIDEAVELAKTYGGPDSPAFVNGILDNVAHACRPRSAQIPNGKSQAPNKRQ